MPSSDSNFIRYPYMSPIHQGDNAYMLLYVITIQRSSPGGGGRQGARIANRTTIPFWSSIVRSRRDWHIFLSMWGHIDSTYRLRLTRRKIQIVHTLLIYGYYFVWSINTVTYVTALLQISWNWVSVSKALIQLSWTHFIYNPSPILLPSNKPVSTLLTFLNGIPSRY